MKACAIGNPMLIACAALACSASFVVLADPPADVMNIVREADIKWVANPVVPGLATAVVQGKPSDPGNPYVIRVRFSPNTMSPPHFHPEARYIVVLKGTWWVDTDPSGTKKRPPRCRQAVSSSTTRTRSTTMVRRTRRWCSRSSALGRARPSQSMNQDSPRSRRAGPDRTFNHDQLATFGY
jgi:hypothetical protein